MKQGVIVKVPGAFPGRPVGLIKNPTAVELARAKNTHYGSVVDLPEKASQKATAPHGGARKGVKSPATDDKNGDSHS